MDTELDQTRALLRHELRTPLAALLGMTDALRRQAFGPLSEPYAEYADLIHQAGEQLLGLGESVISAAPPRYAAVDLGALIAESLRLAQLPQGRCEMQIAAPLAIETDAALVGRILLNLMDNANRYSPAESQVRISARGNGGQVIIEISNGVQTGPGANNSAGIGLAISRRLCQRLGGELVFEHGDDGMARARVLLPATRPA